MKYLIVIVFVFATMVLVSRSSAQSQAARRSGASSLRSQLSQVETKNQRANTTAVPGGATEAGNIEQSLAGVGSTRPEDLREQRRRHWR